MASLPSTVAAGQLMWRGQGNDITADNVRVAARTNSGPIRFSSPLAQGLSELRASNGTIGNDYAATAQDFSDHQLSGTVGNDPGTTLDLHNRDAPEPLREPSKVELRLEHLIQIGRSSCFLFSNHAIDTLLPFSPIEQRATYHV